MRFRRTATTVAGFVIATAIAACNGSVPVPVPTVVTTTPVTTAAGPTTTAATTPSPAASGDVGTCAKGPRFIPDSPRSEEFSTLPDGSVDGNKGITVHGTAACLTAGQSIFLLDNTPDDGTVNGTYYLTTPSAAATGNGHFTAFDGPIAGEGDKDVHVNLVLVLADSNGAKALLTKPANKEGDVTFDALPPGVSVLRVFEHDKVTRS